MDTFNNSFTFVEFFFILNHLLFCTYFAKFRQYNLIQLLIHPIQITFIFVLITVYIPIKIDFVFQHSYLLYEVPSIYFLIVFQSYSFGLFLSYVLIVLFDIKTSNYEAKYEYSNNTGKHIPHNDLRISYTFYFLISMLAAFFLIITNLEVLKSLDINEFSMNIKTGGNNSIFQIFLFITLLPAYLFFSEPGTHQKKLYILTLFILILLIIFGARYPLIVILLSFIYISAAFFNIKAKHLITFSILGISFFVLTSFFRSDTLSSSQGLVSLAAYFIRNNDFLYNSALPIYMKDIGEIDLFFGRTFIEDNLKMFQPSAFFQDKELSFYPSRFFYGTYASVDGRTFNFGFLGRAYMDFGFAGFLLLFILFHLFYDKIYKLLIKNQVNKSSKYFLIILLLVRFPMILMIGLNSHVVSLILIDIIAFYIPNFLARK